MSMKSLSFPVACGLALLLSGCSEPPATPVRKKAEEKIEPVTGLRGLSKMFQVARTWDPRVQILKLNSVHVNEVPDVRAMAAEWDAIFVTGAGDRSRAYTFSVIELLPNLHKGVFSAGEEPHSAAPDAPKPFLIEAVQIDSDKAYETALTKAKDYEAKNPGKPISMILEQTPRHPRPAWRVIWGESASSSNFSVFVDATTGEYLEIMH
jgi:hypothetical protein